MQGPNRRSVLLATAGVLTAPPTRAGTDAPDIVVERAGSRPATVGTADHFTGTVRVDGAFQGTGPARVSGATVTFDPGARTAWHTHPLGQTLIVTAGVGLVQRWAGPGQEIRSGDVVWIPPGVKHWHGATATSGMAHVAVAERLDGRTVDWMEQVTDDQYASPTVHAGATRDHPVGRP